jgi:hypothetical protein
MLAAQQHLENWLKRNQTYGTDLSYELTGFIADNDCSNRVAYWAYEQAVQSGANGWLERQHTELLNKSCLTLFTG